MGSLMKNMENIQSTMGACMRNMETNQSSFNATMKNLETQVRKIAQSLKQSSSKSFPSDIKKNPKECMAITLGMGKELDDSIVVEKQVEAKKNDVDNEKGKVGVENIQDEIKVGDRGKGQNQDEVIPEKGISHSNPPIYTPTTTFPTKVSKSKDG